MNSQTKDVLVIGAGMAGLTAAAALRDAGREVAIIDKGRGVGGRMATRRIGDATFDHGAQFITARDPRFDAVLHRAEAAGAALEWCRGFSSGADGNPRWRGAPGMSALAKHLATGLEIVLGKQAAALREGDDAWSVEMTEGESWSAKSVILTAPVPQALVLLQAGGTQLNTELVQRLAAIEYERCLAVLAVLDGPSRVPPPGALAPTEGPIAWIADNHLKGVSSQPAITLHATDDFSLAHWDQDRDETARHLLAAAAPWLGAKVLSFQIHGWRYSKPKQTDPHPCAIVSTRPALVLAGDAFGAARVEGAALSGWAAAEVILGSGEARSSLRGGGGGE
ncbi:MAG: FAD-dependent oxidoreductase [Verrucomicrobiales bacterium]|nr:FAD-dependent oxidoreductase [Verrucomicrobiales bacterium]